MKTTTLNRTPRRRSIQQKRRSFLGSSQSAHRQLFHRRLQLESLEERRVLAVFAAGAITINDNAVATPYPSNLGVSLPTVSATVVDVNVTLNNLNHTFPDDIDVLLVGPTGANAIVMSDVGGGDDAVGLNLTLDDEAGGGLPDDGPLASGTFQPTNVGGGDAFPAPAPAPSGGSALAAFDTTDPEGTWSLYVVDDQGIDSGALNGGWTLTIQLGGDVAISAGAAANNGVADNFDIVYTATNLQVTVNGLLVFDEPHAGVTSLTILGSSDVDNVTIDGNDVLTDIPISMGGAAGNDTLDIEDLRIEGAPGDAFTADSFRSVDIFSSIFSNNTSGDGIHLTNSGDIVFSQVTASGNDPGVFVNGAATYSDTDGNFSNNNTHGIQLIDISGNVTLVRTIADNNDANDGGVGDGLNATAGVNPAAIGGNLLIQGGRFRDSGGLADHQENGIFVASIAGSVTMESSGGTFMEVTGNEEDGVFIGDGGTTASFTGGAYSNNGQAASHDGIDLGSFSGAVSVSFVTIAGNADTGVQLSGAASLGVTNVNASSNGFDGLSAAAITGAVTISGSTFNSNGAAFAAGDGIAITTAGSLSVSGGTANNNGENGLSANGVSGAVNINGTTFNNNGVGTASGDGIDLANVGAVTLTNVTANGNDPGIIVNGAPSFSDTDGTFNENDGHGIQLIDISGNVTLVRTEANDNDFDFTDDGDGLNATASVNPAAIGGNLLIQGGTFSDTGGLGVQDRGVFVASITGTVTVQNSGGIETSASDNEFDGVEIADGGTNATFTEGNYNSNGFDGIDLNSFSGTVTLSFVTANNNDDLGFEISNVTNGGNTGTVNLSDLTLSGNGGASGNGPGGDLNTIDIVNYTTDTTNTGVADSLTLDQTFIERTVPAQQRITYTSVEFMNLFTRDGDDTITVDGTGASERTLVDSSTGNDTITINGDRLSADNVFFGGTGNDTFTLNIAVNLGNNSLFALDSDIEFDGGDPASNSDNRDVLNINDNSGVARVLTFDYVAFDQLDVGGFAQEIDVDTVETINYEGTGAGDTTTVVGLAATDDDLTVMPTSADSALVFRGGDPWDGPVDGDFFDNLPGVAGGAAGPDLNLDGLASLSFDGGGAGANGDQLYVYAPSEDPVVDPSTTDNLFGFGAGVVIPSAAQLGLIDAFDEIFVTDTNVAILASSAGVNFLDVNILPTSGFVQDNPVEFGLIVNAGFEAAPGIDDPDCGDGIDSRADNLFVTPSFNFAILANGGDPNPSFTPEGDKANIFGFFESIDVYSDKATPPAVTFVFHPFGGPTPFGVGFSSIECLGTLFAQTVNLIGDNNDPAVDQTDNFVVVGAETDFEVDVGFIGDLDSANEFILIINGSFPIPFAGVEFLNAYGFDQDPTAGALLGDVRATPPGTLSPGGQDINVDTLEITASADNADTGAHPPRGWGIDVFFNEGLPNQADGFQEDLIIYHTSIGGGGGGSVSEDVVIQPSGPDNGEIRATNQVDGSLIVVIQYVANTDIIVLDDDLSLSDTDTLTLNGTNPDTVQTSGRDTFNAIFTAAGDVANPMVTVTDTASALILYRLRNFVGFNTITLNPLAGGDTINVTNRVGLTVNANGGDPTAAGINNDALNVNVTGSAQITQGAVSTEGRIDNAGVGDVNFTGFELVGINSPVGDASGVLTARGTDDNDTIALDRLGTSDLIWINDGPVISFTGFESGVNLQGRFGDDKFSVSPIGVLTGAINVIGGDPTTPGDELIVTADAAVNVITFTPSAADGAVIAIAGSPSIGAVTIESVQINGLGGGDTLNLIGTGADDTTLTNPTGGGSGTFRSSASPPLDFISYLNLSVTGGGAFDQVEITGTNGIDLVTSDADTVFFAGAGNVTMDGGVERMLLSTLAGNDNINLDLTSAALLKTVDAGDGNDIVDLAGSVDALIFGGLGDDVLIGSPAADQIFGGPGQDTISGLAGADDIYGEAGNDTIIGGLDVDRLHGGDDFDTFTWNVGDGSDFIDGGDDGADILTFNGSAAAETFTLRPSPVNATHNFVILGAETVDTHGVEQINVFGDAGADNFVVEDLAPTEVVEVNLDVGAAGSADNVRVLGRTVSDNVSITLVTTPGATRVNIAGLAYDIEVLGVALADADTLSFEGREGNDTILSSDSLSALFSSSEVNLIAGAGDDFVSGFGTLFGDAGNDTLVGGAFGQTINGGDGDDQIFGGDGADTLNGNAGEDTFVPGFDLAGDIIDGGTEFDTILVQGNSANNRIDAIQTLSTQVQYEISGINGGDGIVGGAGTETDTLTIATVEQLTILAGSGDDLIRVAHADALVAAGVAVNLLRFTVDGGLPGASDRLTVSDLGVGDTTVQRIGGVAGDGSFTMYAFSGGVIGNPVIALPSVVYTGVEFASLNPLAPITGNTGQVAPFGRLFVFKHDPYEQNNSLHEATFLGANETTNVDPTIDPGADPIGGPGFGLPGDEDWYRIVAEQNGTLDIQVYFDQYAGNGTRAGLPSEGNLEIAVYDVDGLIGAAPVPGAIAGTGAFGTNDTNDDERIRIPVVAGQTYYLRVVGAPFPVGDAENASAAINIYNISVVNTPAPVPFDLELDDRIIEGAVAALGTTTSFNSNLDLQFPDDFFNGKVVSFKFDSPTTPGIRGEESVVLDYVGATGVFTLSLPLSAAPAAGDTFQVESVDTGRNNNDNITRDNTPTIFLRVPDVVNVGGVANLDDLPYNGSAPGNPPDEFIGIPHISSVLLDVPATLAGFRVPIFVTENGTSNQDAPNVLAGYAQPVDPVNRPGVFSFTFGSAGSFIPSLTPDGSYFISARVEMVDPAQNIEPAPPFGPDNQEQAQGYGGYAQSLEIFVDTTEPPVSFGDPGRDDDGLTPDSDSFVIPNPETIIDLVTNDLTPTFWGRAEADATIRLFADTFFDANGNGEFDFSDVDGDGVFEPGDGDAPLFGDLPPNGVFDLNTDVFIGQDTAIPLDGNQQEPNGFWKIESVINFNDPRFFIGLGGSRTVFVTAEDVAGNVNDNLTPQELDIFIDVQGPQIIDVTVNAPSGSIDDVYNLFDPKPSTDGPTPLVNSIFIEIQDFPIRDLVLPGIFDQPAFKPDIAENPGHYLVTGDYNGIFPILDVVVELDPVVDGQPATGRVQLVFRREGPDGVFDTSDDIGAPLPDDRFTLFVNDDGIVDFAGNKLDGESNADEPHDSPPPSADFPDVLGVDGVPTGDGVPGGDFFARFTVDSRPELGVWAAGSAFLDINGNTIWDPDNLDFTNRDITHVFGYVSDDLFAGRFSADDGEGGFLDDGFDKLGAYGRVGTTTFRWLIDTDNDGVPDIEQLDPANVNGLPVAGNFAVGIPGDEVGLYTGTTWFFDTNHDYQVDTSLPWGIAGSPIVGDFDGDGLDDLATWSNDVFSFDLSTINSAGGGLPGNPGIDGTIEKTFRFGFPGPGERPVAADMNQDGIEDVGLWMPARDGITPRGQAEWYFLISGVTQNDTSPNVPTNLGPTIPGSNDPTPGAYSNDPTDYGLSNYTTGRIVVDPLFPNSNIVRFQAVPFGNDQYMQFGDEFALPLVGNFDPPVASSSALPTPTVNPRNQYDVNNDGKVNQTDLLVLINYMTVHGIGPAPTSGFIAAPFVNVNGDSLVNSTDLLVVLNYLTQNPPTGTLGAGEGEAEGEGGSSSDAYFNQLGSGGGAGDDDELLDLLARG